MQCNYLKLKKWQTFLQLKGKGKTNDIGIRMLDESHYWNEWRLFSAEFNTSLNVQSARGKNWCQFVLTFEIICF